ncbi:pectate lyase superfamily protein-domain-containing protein [Cadophora sp. MPI-SDFR-AT-0126]|nr:pectate lyase superfamily protein-domain-containing protein [Leotiomycetes sp. MPI-SDFR-AT-0126]
MAHLPILQWRWIFLLLTYLSTVLSQTNRPNPAIPSNWTQPTRRIFSQAELDQTKIALQQAQAKSSQNSRVTLASSNITIAFSLNKHVNVSEATIAAAQALVSAQQGTDAASRKYRFENPIRNVYTEKKNSKRSDAAAAISTPSSDVLAAAAMLAEIDAAAKYRNGTLYKDYANFRNFSDFQKSTENTLESSKLGKRQSTTFWMEEMQHLGTQPLGGDSTYKVWRNVKDYGATGNGVTDDTAAINAAITDGNRCGLGCQSSSVKGAIVYFPAGTYLVSSPIISLYHTQLVGNGLSSPTLRAAPSFVGFALIQSDVYIPNANGAEWYLNTGNFYRQVRNFIIDISEVKAANAYGIHWQVAQATSLQNIAFLASSGASSTQISIFAENGSGGFMNDLLISGGLYGLSGNQQFTTRNMWFIGVQTAIQLNWDWGWTWKSLLIENCNVGINVVSSQANPPGSIYILDSTFNTVGTAILSSPFLSQEQGTTVMVLDNNAYVSVGVILGFTDGTNAGIPTSGYPKLWGHGNVDYAGAAAYGQNGYALAVDRPASLVTASASLPQGNIYFERSKPQYASVPAANFVNMKLLAKGDGVTDDTNAINFVLALAASQNTNTAINSVVFFPAGTYLVTGTIHIPSNSYIVGECWAQIMATGAAFQNQESPLIMVQVGDYENATPTNIEISDMLFTTRGPTAGLIAMQWNAYPLHQGSVGMWDTHFRIGGAMGTELQVADCPTLTGSINSDCIAATAMLWITTIASGYFENVWAWIADHDLDDPTTRQIDIYGGRGILVESVHGPNWLYGTASEHAVLYQYELFQTSNTFMGMIQTETPYYQGVATTWTPTPFTLGLMPGDIAHDGCDFASNSAPCRNAYALKVINTNDIVVAGAGLYSWFIEYDQTCLNHQSCQQQMVYTFGNNRLQLYNLITIGAVEMISPFGTTAIPAILSADNMDATTQPWWSVIGVYLNEVAFGDSFASGPGAGELYDDSIRSCWRYTNAYPPVLHKMFERIALTELDFQFLACSGSTTESQKFTKQVSDWVPTLSNLGTLHIGGNDALFGDVLVACILKPYYTGGDCNTALANSAAVIASTALVDKLLVAYNSIFDRAGGKTFALYVMGYPEFFDIPGVADDCGTLGADIGPKPRITIALREQLRTLTQDLNNVIQSTVASMSVAAASKITFVPWPAAAFNGHRFCTAGYSLEPIKDKYENAHNYFFRWFGEDNYEGEEDNWPPVGTLPAPPPPLIPSTYNERKETVGPLDCSGEIYDYEDVLCNWAAEAKSNATFAAQISTLNDPTDGDQMNFTIAWDQTDGVIVLGSDGGAPLEGSTETFHPRTMGHKLIANAFFDVITGS